MSPLLLMLAVNNVGFPARAVPVNDQPHFDKTLTGFKYPYPVKTFSTVRQHQTLNMAYMDIMPENPQGTVVLMHGKNFSGYYFKPLIAALKKQNYRVIVPDQVGFGKSSKPENFQYSFHGLAELTHALLKKESVTDFVLVGHSIGGMLSARYALNYPAQVKKLVLVNPIGLEDYQQLTGYKPIHELYLMERKKTPQDLKKYQQKNYYDGDWKPEYAKLLVPAIGWLNGPHKGLINYTAAQTADMIYTQPVVHEFKYLTMPTILIIGQRDTTALGRGWAPETNKGKMGNYKLLGPRIAAQIPDAELIKMDGLGHMPFIEDPEAFMPLFLKAVAIP